MLLGVEYMSVYSKLQAVELSKSASLQSEGGRLHLRQIAVGRATPIYFPSQGTLGSPKESRTWFDPQDRRAEE